MLRSKYSQSGSCKSYSRHEAQKVASSKMYTGTGQPIRDLNAYLDAHGQPRTSSGHKIHNPTAYRNSIEASMRQNTDDPKYLYHYTHPDAAAKIQRSGILHPSSQGMAGRGTYLTAKPPRCKSSTLLSNNYGKGQQRDPSYVDQYARLEAENLVAKHVGGDRDVWIVPGGIELSPHNGFVAGRGQDIPDHHHHGYDDSEGCYDYQPNIGYSSIEADDFHQGIHYDDGDDDAKYEQSEWHHDDGNHYGQYSTGQAEFSRGESVEDEVPRGHLLETGYHPAGGYHSDDNYCEQQNIGTLYVEYLPAQGYDSDEGACDHFQQNESEDKGGYDNHGGHDDGVYDTTQDNGYDEGDRANDDSYGNDHQDESFRGGYYEEDCFGGAESDDGGFYDDESYDGGYDDYSYGS